MKIAIIADTHVAEAAPAFNANCAAALRWIDAAGADLAIHLGDVTADGVRDAEHFATAQKMFFRLRTPIHYLPGNHDIGDNFGAGEPGDEPAVRPEGLGRFRGAFGRDRWVIVAEGWTLIGLDSQVLGPGDAQELEQAVWLQEVLAAASGPIGLLLHKPLFRDGPGNPRAHKLYVPPAACRRLLGLFSAHDLRFVVSGHVHQWRRTRIAGVDHVWVPSTAFIVPDVLQERIGEKVLGVLTMTLGPEHHEVVFHSPPGMNLHDLADYPDVYPQLAAAMVALSVTKSRAGTA